MKRPEKSRHPPRAIVAAEFMWIVSIAAFVFILGDVLRVQPAVWLYDYNVYYAAAIDLVQRDLYRVPLVLPGIYIPVDVFNYPPLAAAWILPLLPLGREGGGLVFAVLSIAAVVIGLIVAVRALGIRRWWLWTPAILAVYHLLWHYDLPDVALGNNNMLVFLLVALFAAAHIAGRQRSAGLLLGIAIGTKLWPVALIVLILRERRWQELRWAAGIVAAQAVLFLLWLGPGVLPPMIAAVLFNTPRDLGTEPVLWISAFRVLWEWWPTWGGYAIAAVLVALPARGRLGLGLGVIAGLSLNANLWHHYIWSFVLGLMLIAAAPEWRSIRIRLSNLRGSRSEAPSPP